MTKKLTRARKDQLIRGTFQSPLRKDGHRNWYRRGYLPHIDRPGLVQIVTFRLADALPNEVLQRMESELRFLGGGLRTRVRMVEKTWMLATAVAVFANLALPVWSKRLFSISTNSAICSQLGSSCRITAMSYSRPSQDGHCPESSTPGSPILPSVQTTCWGRRDDSGKKNSMTVTFAMKSIFFRRSSTFITEAFAL